MSSAILFSSSDELKAVAKGLPEKNALEKAQLSSLMKRITILQTPLSMAVEEQKLETSVQHTEGDRLSEIAEDRKDTGRKAPLLIWLDRQIDRANRNWEFVTACAAGMWFFWHYKARK